MDWPNPSIAPNEHGAQQLVQITHPFHPEYGEEFEVVAIRNNWSEDRVYFLEHDGSVANTLARWTSVIEPDPFVITSAGRSYFRVGDLLELSRLLLELEGSSDE